MKVICVDDEQPVLDNFKMKTKDFKEIESLKLFLDGNSAIEWVKNNQVDTAFLDMEMSDMNGIELAKKLKEIDRNIRIIYVTAFGQYALEAFGVDAIGYILKPYTREDIYRELEKASLVRPRPQKHIKIQTMPRFSISVDGNMIHFGREKTEELLALLVDRGMSGLTAGEAIACLWPDRPGDDSTKNLYRVTFHRLMEVLKSEGIDDIISSEGRKKYILKDRVECDLYQILDGDREMLLSYSGTYLKDYSWAEERNAQLNSMMNAVGR